MDVIVTDHHQPGPELPDCPILHPAVDGYPFEELCGTAVAWKLACALRGASGVGSPGSRSRGVPGDPTPDAPADADLDLVALATVADVVPLVGENRSLVERGLEEVRRARGPGCGRCWRRRNASRLSWTRAIWRFGWRRGSMLRGGCTGPMRGSSCF